MSLFNELKRRNVFRAATAYVVVSWIIMQVIDVMSEALNLPDWVDGFVALLLIIGLPLVIAFSWAYEVTPEGVKATEDVVTTDSIATQTAKRLDLVIIAGLVFVGGLIVWQQTAPSGRSLSPDNAQTTPAASADATAPGNSDIGQPSIAVLPFDDLSQAGDQEYFADGVAEAVLNTLAKTGALKIAGRTSSFSFKGKKQDFARIGQVLGVAHVLDGSIRQQGNQVRISAQLISVDDGFTLWSDTYDGTLDDIFAVQDNIAAEILGAMKTQFAIDPSERLSATARTDFRAYNLYLEAKPLVASRDSAALQQASDLLDQALAIDDSYAPLYAERALVESLRSDSAGAYGDIPRTEALPRAREWNDKALQLDPNLAEAHAMQGLLYIDESELEKAIVSLREALELNPNLLNARNWLSLALTSANRFRDGTEAQLALYELDPLYRPLYANLITGLINVGQTDHAQQIVDDMRRREVAPNDYLWSQAVVQQDRGELAAAIKNADQARATDMADRGRGISQAFVELQLGVIEPIMEYDDGKVYGLMAEQRYAEAVENVTSRLAAEPKYTVLQIDYITTLSAAADYTALADYYKQTYGNAQNFEESLFSPFNGTGALPPFGHATYALQQAGETELAAELMQRWRTAIDVGRASGADNIDFDSSDAMWHALNGDGDSALRFVERIAERRNGLLGWPHMPQISVARTILGEDERFEALWQMNTLRINEEREKLGLASVDI